MKSIILFFVVFLLQRGFTQTLKVDTVSTVICFKNELETRVFTGVKNMNYVHRNHFFSSSSDDVVKYDSPTTIYLGLGVHTEFIGFHLWFGTGKLIDEDPRDNSRKFVDFQANLYTKRVAYDLNWQHYKGLYRITNDQKKYQKTDEIFHLGGVLLYSLQKEYSLPSSFTQIDKQLKSKGSPLLFGGFSYSNILLQHEAIVDTKVLGMSIGVGYGYNLIYKNWFLSGVVAGAPMLQRNDKFVKVGIHANYRVGVGYNSLRWVYGVTFVGDSQVYRFVERVDRLDKNHVKIFLGYRFGYDWYKHKLFKKLLVRYKKAE